VTAYTDDFDIAVSCVNRPNDFQGDAGNSAAVSFNVCSERNFMCDVASYSTVNPFFRNLFIVQYVVDFKGTETPGNPTQNFLQQSPYNFFVSHRSSTVSNTNTNIVNIRALPKMLR